MNPWHTIVRNVMACPYDTTRSIGDRQAQRSLQESDKRQIMETFLRLKSDGVLHASKETAVATGWTAMTVSRVLREKGLM